MDTYPSLVDVDTDGAIQETAERAGVNRAAYILLGTGLGRPVRDNRFLRRYSSAMTIPASAIDRAASWVAAWDTQGIHRTGTAGVADKQTAVRNFPVWGKTVWDSISHVASRPEVDAQRIGLLGFSLGAYLALSVAAVDARVKAVVDFFGGMPREMKLFIRRLCPTLILHGESDATVPVAEAYHLQQLLEKKATPYEIQIYPNAGHGFSGEIWQDAKARTLSFLQRYLVNSAA